MNIWDILILAAVGAMVFFAARAIRGRKGSCSCGSGGCAGCAAKGSCPHCENND
ncbi:MAG: FeoB-associated Cys-rich membrane protein [Clostridia bacterium]|nr:FeoB-associated Cys-rich membrane protein [Clostridia bacterium]